ncbi:MAG: metalloprotease family protein [Flavobacteriales bacterium]
MFFIPGQFIALLTFPGVIVHEAAHMFFCRLRKVAVFDVVFFQFDTVAGYVSHERTDNFVSTFLISMGPFFINTALCFLICFPAYLPISFFNMGGPLSYFLMWLGLSIGMHAIPSNQDANNLFDEAKVRARKLDPLALVSMPLVLLIYIFNVARFFWADLLYGVAIGVWLPSAFY